MTPTLRRRPRHRLRRQRDDGARGVALVLLASAAAWGIVLVATGLFIHLVTVH